jgi:hypothetical protein
MSDAKPLLEAEMDELQKWFYRLYGTTRKDSQLKIYYKYNRERRREEYILDLFFDSTSRSLPFQVPADALELLDVRLKIKERWVPEMQKRIMEVMG